MDSKKKVPRGKAKQEEEKAVGKKVIQVKKEQVSSAPPVRSRSSYILFTMEIRPQVVRDHPDAPPKEIMRAMGNKWSSLSEEEKKPYEEMAKRDKERNERQTEEYEKEGRYYDDNGNVVVEEKKGTKRKAEPMNKDKSSDDVKDKSKDKEKDKMLAKKKPIPMKKKKS